MKSLISIAFGAAALALGTFGAATPAAADSNVGVYIGPNGAAISIGERNRCRDYWYRRNHPYRCGYGNYYRSRGHHYGQYRNRCRDYWYRRNHPRKCGYRDYRRYD